MTESVDLVKNATEYAREHLAECAADLLAWQNTGLLPEGELKHVGKMLLPLNDNSGHNRDAERIVERLALEHAAAQIGNKQTEESIARWRIEE